MSETELPNSDAARTETGELKPDLSTSPQETKTTPETKPTETKPEEATKSTTAEEKKETSLLNKDEKKEEATGAPEKYEDFKVPEGFEIDEAQGKEIGELFKEMNLSQAQGQKLVDHYAKQMQEAAQAPFKYWKETNDKWTAEIKADPEIGHKLPEVRATVTKAIDGLGDPKLASAFREAMDLTGAGNNPAFVRAFFKLAQKVTEGSHVSGAGPSKHGQNAPGSTERPSTAKSLYPNLP